MNQVAKDPPAKRDDLAECRRLWLAGHPEDAVQHALEQMDRMQDGSPELAKLFGTFAEQGMQKLQRQQSRPVHIFGRAQSPAPQRF